MRECRTYGSVRGALGNGRSYRDQLTDEETDPHMATSAELGRAAPFTDQKTPPDNFQNDSSDPFAGSVLDRRSIFKTELWRTRLATVSTRIRQMDQGDATQRLGNPRENVDPYFHPLPSSLSPALIGRPLKWNENISQVLGDGKAFWGIRVQYW